VRRDPAQLSGPAEQVQRINLACSDLPGVIEVTSMRSRQAGPSAWIDMEVAVKSDISVKEAHQVTEQVQETIKGLLGKAARAQVKFRSSNGSGNGESGKPVLGVGQTAEDNA